MVKTKVTKKVPLNYWLLKRYNVKTAENKNKLIDASSIQFFGTDSECLT